MSLIELSPSEIRYSQDSIKATFQNGTPLSDVIADIISGRKSPNDIPSIDVYLRNGTYYSSDNRRLYVFKEVQRIQPDLKIKVILNRILFVPKLTTRNGGRSIEIRD
uniref:Uncharacterized protein n=1 Tax=Octopus bimaculoides TaxID=37653 RepID=A0A0L8HIY3_OCTBM